MRGKKQNCFPRDKKVGTSASKEKGNIYFGVLRKVHPGKVTAGT